MKFEYANTPVAVEGNIVSSNYGAKECNIPLLMSMLQTTLYSDKPLAVCREYITNAWDAHVDAGIADKPIQISIPTSFSPVLKIRDFGKGLSQEDVLYHFTSYGDSGKRHTDDMVGGFGLGSKSAFCYVPSFTVVSYHDGVKMTFNAQIEEKNCTMNHLVDLDTPTDETGLEIIVSVKSYDTWNFRQTLANLLRYHKPFPVIVNDDNFINTINQPDKVLVENDNWKVIQNISNKRVILGNVPYEFETHHLQLAYDVTDHPIFRNHLGLVIEMPPNTLNVTLNREALEYTPKTIHSLKAVVLQAVKEYDRAVDEKFKNTSSVWEAKVLWRTLSVKGFPVVDGHRITNCRVETKDLIYHETKSLNFYGKRWISGDDIMCGENTVIYIARPDIAMSSVRLRIKMHMDSNNLERNHDNGFHYFIFKSDADADNFINSTHIRGANIVELNSIYLPKVTKANVRTVSIKSQAYEFNRGSWDAIAVDLNNGDGVFVPMAYNRVSLPGWWQEHSNFSSVYHAFNRFSSTNVIGIKNQEVKRLGKGWVGFLTHMNQWMSNAPYDVVYKLMVYELIRKYDETLFQVSGHMPITHPYFETMSKLASFYDKGVFNNWHGSIRILEEAGVKWHLPELFSLTYHVDNFIKENPVMEILGYMSDETKKWEIAKHYLAKDQ